MRKPPCNFTPGRKATYLKSLEATGEVSASAAAAGVSRASIYYAMEHDDAFREACETAKGVLTGLLLKTCHRLAIDGVLHETLDPETGKVIRRKRVYDTRILLAWLKRRDREHWGDQVKVAKTVQVTHTARIEVENLTPASRLAARRLLATLPRITVDETPMTPGE